MEFLDELGTERPDVAIQVYDIGDSTAARERLAELFVEHGIAAGGVPAFEICSDLIVGFSSAETTGAQILERLAQVAPAERNLPTRWGSLDVDRLGLPLFTIALGLLDGFNPCAMWVLLILLSILVNVQDRRKLLAVAGTFVAVSGLAYFAFMAAWLNIFLVIGWSRSTQIVLGCVAFGAGAIHLKDLLAPQHGPSLSIPKSAKPGLYRRMRAIVRAESLGTALIAATALAVMVNLIELLCTAGLPAVYTQILTLQNLSTPAYYGYLALYNFAYVCDDALMVTIVVVTLDRFKLQERAGRWLKGLSGAILGALGSILLLRPEWLTR